MRTAGGATAAAAAGSAATGTAAAQEAEPDWGSWFDSANVGTYVDARGQSEVTVTVGAGDGLGFDPTGLWVDPGTTVTWEWSGAGGAHNVVAENGPAALDSGSQVDEEGFTYEYEFTEEDAGITQYVCQPHQSVNMFGGVAVGEDVPVVEQGGNTGWPEDITHVGIPFHPHWIGLIASVAITMTLVFTFYVLKYGESAHAGHGGR